jgi:hypothetical protein
MKKLLLTALVGGLLVGCVAPEPEKEFHPTVAPAPADAFHPTDALLIGGNGGFNPSDGGADLGDLDAPAPADAFHPTDALLIGGNGGFNPSDGGADLGDY